MILEFWQGAGDPLRGVAVIVRAFAMIAALGAAGAALFLVFSSERLTREEARSARGWLLLFVVLALAALAALWPFRAAELSGIRDGMTRWALYPEIARSAFGDAAFLMAAGLILLVFARVRTAWGAGLATAGALLVALGLTLSGHAAGHPRRQELVALGTLHVFASAFWFGSLLPLRAMALRRDPASAAEDILVWSRQALVFAALAIATGLVMALMFAGPPTALVRGGYGLAAIAKSAFVLAMGLGALACRFRHARLMQRGDVLAGDSLRRSCTRQFLFGLVVLYLTAEIAAAELAR
jgi:putative copper export protein